MNAVLRCSFVHVVSAGNIYAQYRRSILCLYHSDLRHSFEDLFIRLARLAFEGETEQSVDDDAYSNSGSFSNPVPHPGTNKQI